MKWRILAVSLMAVSSACVETAQDSNTSVNVGGLLGNKPKTPEIPTCSNGSMQEVFGMATGTGSVRLVFCYDWATNKREFMQFVYNRSSFMPYVTMKPENVVSAQNLETLALPGEDITRFRLELASSGATVLLTRTDENLGIKVDSPALGVLEGTLAVGDVFDLCFESQGGSFQSIREIVAGSANLSLTLCTGAMGTSGGSPWDVVALKVRDANSKLAKPIDISWGLVELRQQKKNGVVKEGRNHHNVCDSLLIKLPEVSYGIVNVGNITEQGEELKCSLSPEFSPFQVREDSRATYRNIYGDLIEEGLLPFSNFF